MRSNLHELERLPMEAVAAWSAALHDPALRDLPYKIETNEYGQLVMSPLKPRHGRIQSRIAVLLADVVKEPGSGAVELAVVTPKGIKSSDVAWMSEERWAQIGEDVEASPVAPEICVEVLSASNTRAEIDEKRRLYFECGAQEVWTCDMKGQVRFFTTSGEAQRSGIAPDFPVKIEI